MLLSLDKRVAIPTATKTGTFSLESATTRSGTFEQLMPRHRTSIPESHHGAHVLLILRHPHARLVSMYRYGIVKKHSWLLKAGADGFDAFCKEWAAAYDTNKVRDWTTLLTEYSDAARAVASRLTTFNLEEHGVARLLARAAEITGQPLKVADKHINRSADRFEEPWRALWTSAALKAVGHRLDPDLELGGYHKPRPANVSAH